MSKYENKKIKNSTSETRKLFLNFISKTRNKGSSINDINNRTNIFSKKNLNQENNIKESDKNIRELISKEKATTKIDYRHYKTYPIKEIFPFSIENLQKESEEHYWLITYDKLIKSKKILKILNYGIKVDKKPIYTEHNLKVKYMKIQDYEIFFVKGFDKPFVRPKEDSFILVKLYFLSIKEINKILNYINKTKDKMNIDKYINPSIANNENNICEFLNINKKIQDEDISYPYCYFYHVGMFMNISMILFTNTFNYPHEEEDNNKLLYSLPSSKKLYKLIKLLIKSFPEYSANYFMEYLIKRNLYKNYEEKKNEILNLLSSVNISIPNKLLLNKVIRETITGIQTNSSISGSSIHIESNESSKCHPILIENQKNNSLIYNKNLNEFKNSLKSNNGIYINGQVVTTNYLSTNHTSIPYNSIKTLKNSFKNNVPSITIPYEINNAKKERDSIGIYLTGSYHNNNQKRIINHCLQKRNKEEEKNENKKFINKNIAKGKNSENKENININNILNKKKVDIFTKIGNKSLNWGSIISRNKKKEYKSNNSKIYHTPKKRKKMNYYK